MTESRRGKSQRLLKTSTVLLAPSIP
ncbi:hypothetical protein MY4038_007609 [Beauveria bassiana]